MKTESNDSTRTVIVFSCQSDTSFFPVPRREANKPVILFLPTFSIKEEFATLGASSGP